jgi:hypothetical protein
MSSTSWRGQVYRALQAIDCFGHSKYEAKQAQGWQPGRPVYGLYSFGYKNLVFDRAITFTNRLHDQYPHVRLFRDVDSEMTAEYLNEKAETCTPDTLRTALATLKKLQEGPYAMNWIKADLVPADWPIEGRNPPRGPYAPLEAQAINQQVAARSPEYGQALRFILSSGARINEALQLRADKVFLADGQVELLGKGWSHSENPCSARGGVARTGLVRALRLFAGGAGSAVEGWPGTLRPAELRYARHSAARGAWFSRDGGLRVCRS